MFYSSTLGRDCFALFQPRRWPTPSSVLAGVPPREDALTHPSGSMPPCALWQLCGPEGRQAVGPVCGESVDTWDRALAPTLPPSGPARPTTLLTTRGSAQRRNPATPAYLRAVRTFLSFHWAQWPSITGAGGRVCALSAAIATARPERGSAAEGRAAVSRAPAGARVGDMVSAGGPWCSFQLTAFRARGQRWVSLFVYPPTPAVYEGWPGEKRVRGLKTGKPAQQRPSVSCHQQPAGHRLSR